MKYVKFIEIEVNYMNVEEMEKFIKWLEESVAVWEVDGGVKFNINRIEQGVNR